MLSHADYEGEQRVLLTDFGSARDVNDISRLVSIRIANGVNYRVGRMRGHSVAVGKHLEAQDSGVLVVTDRRAVFMGTEKTLEFRRVRLVGLERPGCCMRLLQLLDDVAPHLLRDRRPSRR